MRERHFYNGTRRAHPLPPFLMKRFAHSSRLPSNGISPLSLEVLGAVGGRKNASRKVASTKSHSATFFKISYVFLGSKNSCLKKTSKYRKPTPIFKIICAFSAEKFDPNEIHMLAGILIRCKSQFG